MTAPKNTKKVPIPATRRQAFRYIELMLQWEGRVNSTHVAERLSCSTKTAKEIIRQYQALFPDAFDYDDSAKAYLPTDMFTPQCGPCLLHEYILLDTHNQAYRLGSNEVALQQEQFIYTTISGFQEPHAPIVRKIIQAIKQNMRVDMAYASMSLTDPNSEAIQERIVSPHSLVYDGFRWHTRAWCEKSQGFRDFVLIRIRDVFELEGQAEKNIEDDEKWNTWVDFVIEPDPRLTLVQQKRIALDFGMQPTLDGKYERHCQARGPLVLYTLRQLGIHHQFINPNPQAQQIVLKTESLQRLKPWLP